MVGIGTPGGHTMATPAPVGQMCEVMDSDFLIARCLRTWQTQRWLDHIVPVSIEQVSMFGIKNLTCHCRIWRVPNRLEPIIVAFNRTTWCSRRSYGADQGANFPQGTGPAKPGVASGPLGGVILYFI